MHTKPMFVGFWLMSLQVAAKVSFNFKQHLDMAVWVLQDTPSEMGNA